MSVSVEITSKEAVPLAGNATARSAERVAPDRFCVGTTALLLAAVAMLSKMMGFGEKIVIARYFGTTSLADTYFAATSILLPVVFLVRELIHPTLLPTLSEAMTISSGIFNDLFVRMFRRVLLLVILAAAAGAILMPQVVNLLVPGFQDQQKADLARLLRWLLPAGMLMAMIAVTYTTLNAKGRLVTASLAEAAFKAILLVCAAILIPFGGLGAIPIAMLAGAAVCLVIHLAVLRPRGIVRRFGESPSPASDRLLGRTATLMAPIILGVVFSHISDLVDNLLASQLPEGQLSYLSYAKKITDAILLAGPAALATVLYARASRLASLSKHHELTELVGKGLRLLLFLGVPIGCMMIELRVFIVRALFQHGSFDLASTAGVAQALVVYGFGLAALSIEGLCVYSFYSLSDTRTPVAAGVICVILNVILAVLLAGSMGYLGIAAALVIAKSVKVAALLALLHRKLDGNLLGRWWPGFTIRLAAAAALMWLAARLVGSSLAAGGTGAVLPLTCSFVTAAIVYIGLSHLLGLREPRLLMDAVPWQKLLARRGAEDQ